MLKNCFKSENVMSCLSAHGEVESWSDCKKSCNLKLMNAFYLDDYFAFGLGSVRTRINRP